MPDQYQTISNGHLHAHTHWIAHAALLSFVLHLDKHLASLIAAQGDTTYAILFGIVFAETGFVLTPFLPGDSLLFATGALAATGVLQLQKLMAVFIVAAILGDACNYAVGQYLGASLSVPGRVAQSTDNRCAVSTFPPQKPAVA